MGAPRLIPNTGDRVIYATLAFGVVVELVRQAPDIVTVNVKSKTSPATEGPIMLRPWTARALAAILVAAADEANRQGGGEGGISL